MIHPLCALLEQVKCDFKQPHTVSVLIIVSLLFLQETGGEITSSKWPRKWDLLLVQSSWVLITQMVTQKTHMCKYGSPTPPSHPSCWLKKKGKGASTSSLMGETLKHSVHWFLWSYALPQPTNISCTFRSSEVVKAYDGKQNSNAQTHIL